MLELYWSIGADIANRQAESRWGSKVIWQLSNDLRNEFPDAQGYSETNLKYMKRFYLAYHDSIDKLLAESSPPAIGHQLGDRLETRRPTSIDEDAGPMPPLLASIPWRHHIEILIHSSTTDEAVFYMKETFRNGWSRAALKDNIRSGLFSRQGQAPNNFARLLPEPQGMLASEMLKDPYNFDFLSLKNEHVEKELEDALVRNVTKLLMELGRGFAFLGQQVPVMAGRKELWIDLLFYHVVLHCYVVVELKAEDFEAAHIGQLGAYVAAVNHQMRGVGDSPTVGLLICRSKDSVYAGYSLEGSSQPIGISAYELSNPLPDELRAGLPSIEDIESTLRPGDTETCG